MENDTQREVELGGITYIVISHFNTAMDIGPILERLALASVLEE